MTRGQGSFLTGHDFLICSDVFASAALLYVITEWLLQPRRLEVPQHISQLQKVETSPICQGNILFLLCFSRQRTVILHSQISLKKKNSQTKTTYKNIWNHYLFTDVPNSIPEPRNIANTGFLKLLRIQSAKHFSFAPEVASGCISSSLALQ